MSQLGEGIIGHAAQQRMPLLVPDVRKDPRYIVANPEVRSELSVPLIYKGKVIGVIDLEHTRVNYYNEDHQTTLSTLAAQVAISIANARLYQRISEEEQRLERDLAMAREVQLRLLPRRLRSRGVRRLPRHSCPRAPSAATSTTSSTTVRPAMRSTRHRSASASPLCWAMSPARLLRLRCMPRWCRASCARWRRATCRRRICWRN